MRRITILLALAGQLFYLVGLVANREILLRSDTTVFLRTVPVDPRDPFRGDYVALRYDINAVAADAIRGRLAEHRHEDDVPVFAVLDPVPGSTDLVRLGHLTDTVPRDRLFLAGTTVQNSRFRAPKGGLAARYDIETLFVQQGHGLEIEAKRGRPAGLQVPMEIELAVNTGGKAAIRGYRWSPIGITFDIARFDGQVAPEAHVTLHNVSDETQWLVDPGDHCSFGLIPGDWGADGWPAGSPLCERITPTPADVRRLEPGATYSVALNLNLARWHLDVDGHPLPIDRIGELGTERFRVVYRPDPSWSEILEVPGGQLWLTELPSPAFTAVGRID